MSRNYVNLADYLSMPVPTRSAIKNALAVQVTKLHIQIKQLIETNAYPLTEHIHNEITGKKSQLDELAAEWERLSRADGTFH
ncbi:unnamed protein product [Didymodactylos carnosus]|uniref:Uncharacterized protein n=1 Tax=Didymodactylos carnosus TaxID=1234261 RepID=A0A815QTL3_9BILA|nr:unnamed protein product [Didymodactylos carnosus]CAF1467665.1 unnamed protein product [Didymodactylos carnosus]CAF4207069.1 unnamed protein product [Didymodactylos carnosus]CAF4336365.1 unnamed protein product [Didymodactylos carnosus]